MAKNNKLNEEYSNNKAAKVGSDLICPVCGSHFTKKQWAQAFCCNECKNKYWNRKGDRHREGYYEDYDLSHPSRLRNRIAYGSSRLAAIAGVKSTLDQYTDAEIKEMYKNHKYGSTESCHPFDLDGQFAESEF